MNLSELVERLGLPVETRLPPLTGATGWLNTTPLTPAALNGKVVLVDFWTYTCINWIRTLPYVRAWARTYGPHGLIVVGVHTPEFGVEHDVDGVRHATRRLGVDHPVALDNRYDIWNAFANLYWPALYLADAEGRIRYHHFGEGAYERTERIIRRILSERGATDLPRAVGLIEAHGIEAAADWHPQRSPETYLGFERSAHFASPGGQADAARRYALPSRLRRNEWALDGHGTVGREGGVLNETHGRIAFRFRARDVNLVLSPADDRTPVRFRVALDGAPPAGAHGVDTGPDGDGVVHHPGVYQLIRLPGPIEDHTFTIELFERDATALCFTFG